MANVTLEDRTELDRLLIEFFQQQHETVSPDVTTTLTCVAVGYLERSLGYLPPLPRGLERSQLAGHLGGIYLQGTRPSPNNNYAGQLLQLAVGYLAKKGAPPMPPAALPILVTMAMGATRETDPRATRAGITVHFVDLYLEGR